MGSHKVHGAPLGPDALAEMKEHLGMNLEATFQVPAEVSEFYAAVKAGAAKHAEWNAALDAYSVAFPAAGAELKRRIAANCLLIGSRSFPRTLPARMPRRQPVSGRSCRSMLYAGAARANRWLRGSHAVESHPATGCH